MSMSRPSETAFMVRIIWAPRIWCQSVGLATKNSLARLKVMQERATRKPRLAEGEK